MTASQSATLDLSSDLLCGAAAIAEFMFGDPKLRRQVYHLAEYGRGEQKIPCFRLGAKLCARKSTLSQWITQQEISRSIVGGANR